MCLVEQQSVHRLTDINLSKNDKNLLVVHWYSRRFSENVILRPVFHVLFLKH